MNFDSDEENSPLDDDYYAFLNLSKEATKEEINNAYRRLSRIYHPDKHTDPEKKLKAEILFNKTKRAYEVLSDPHQRAIYDNLGVKGLETEGWEIVQRTKTPAEIRAEYEQLAEERSERRKQQRTNPHGSISVSINATDLFNPYIDEYDEDEFDVESDSLFPSIEVSGMTFNQSVDFPLTQRDTASLSGRLQTHNGTGGGEINLSLRHIYSHRSWAEMDFGAGNGPSFSFKAFKTLTNRCFWNGGAVLQFMPQGVRHGLFSTLAMQIDKHTVGYFTYNAGLKNSVSTSIVRDAENNLYNVSVLVGLPHSYLSFNYTRKMLNNELKLRLAVKVGTFGGVFEYGVEKKVSKHSLLAASVAVGVPTGVKLKIKLTRANQVYSFPIHLCEEVMPAPILYGTILPLVIYGLVKKGIVEPFLKEQEAKKAETEKQNNRTKLLEKRKEAQAAIDLMTVTYERIVREEEAKKGLIIEAAFYGKVQRGGEFGDTADEILNVTVPVQCLVKDSKLMLHDHTKSQLPGFFDPALGEAKYLYIKYKYHDQPHEVTIHDNEILRIPKSAHRSSVT